MKKIYWSIVTFMLFVICATVWSGAPTYRQGEDIIIETGVTPPDRVPTWCAPMQKRGLPLYILLESVVGYPESVY